MPSITVIVPYKSNFKFLKKSLNSILAQTYKKYRILIIYDDDKKPDLEKIKRFVKIRKKKKFFYLKIILNKKNFGVGISRNIGIKYSQSKYIAFLDSDDIWHKDKLKLHLKFMEKYKLPISFTFYEIIDENGKKISSRESKERLNFNDMLKSCDIGLSTVIINSNFLNINKLKFPKITTKEDYVLWLKILKKIPYIKGLDKHLTYYRKTKGSLSSNIITKIKNGYLVYRKYLKMSFFGSVLRLIILSYFFGVNKIKRFFITTRQDIK